MTPRTFTAYRATVMATFLLVLVLAALGLSSRGPLSGLAVLPDEFFAWTLQYMNWPVPTR